MNMILSMNDILCLSKKKSGETALYKSNLFVYENPYISCISECFLIFSIKVIFLIIFTQSPLKPKPFLRHFSNSLSVSSVVFPALSSSSSIYSSLKINLPFCTTNRFTIS